MSYKRLFIVLEGVDGSGKTSVGKILAERLGAFYFKTPSGIWQRSRHLVEDRHPFLRFLYYLLATYSSSFTISNILKQKSVICDRYIYSTWCHHIVYGCAFLKCIPMSWIPIRKPDFIYYLSVSNEEREKRVSKRRGNNYKDKDSDSLIKVHKQFTNIVNMKKIDTTDQNIKQVVDAICRNLSKRFNQKPAVETNFN